MSVPGETQPLANMLLMCSSRPESAVLPLLYRHNTDSGAQTGYNHVRRVSASDTPESCAILRFSPLSGSLSLQGHTGPGVSLVGTERSACVLLFTYQYESPRMPRPSISEEHIERLTTIVDARLKVPAKHLTTEERLGVLLDELEEADAAVDRLSNRVDTLEQQLDEVRQDSTDSVVDTGSGPFAQGRGAGGGRY